MIVITIEEENFVIIVDVSILFLLRNLNRKAIIKTNGIPDNLLNWYRVNSIRRNTDKSKDIIFAQHIAA